MRWTWFPLLALAGLLLGCSGRSPVMESASFPPAARGGVLTSAAAEDYRLGPLDTIAVRVFREPELSFESLPVSLSGKISYPLLGEIDVGGLSTNQVARLLSDRLNARYLRNASVSVSLERAANFVVTVEGEVESPGVYQIPGARLSLLQSIALAKGATELAKLDEVLVIRQQNDQRYIARFDLRAIRTGQAPDPEIQQSDVVVVGFDRAESLLQTSLTVLPSLGGLFIALIR